MNRLGKLTLVPAALVFAIAASINVELPEKEVGKAQPFAVLSFTSAAAAPRHQARRVTRRTARRTTRRVVRRHSIAGCAFRAPYYYCGGVYYRPIVENGTTVYIVVNP